MTLFFPSAKRLFSI